MYLDARGDGPQRSVVAARQVNGIDPIALVDGFPDDFLRRRCGGFWNAFTARPRPASIAGLAWHARSSKPGYADRYRIRFRTRAIAVPPPATRTPEGRPGRCPLCGTESTFTPADPLADAPCPACGTLLWPLPAAEGGWFFLADRLTGKQRSKLREIAQRFREGDLDSLTRVEVLMELEESLDLSIPDEVAERFETIDDFVLWWQQDSAGDR